MVEIKTSKKWVYFYDEGILLHKIKNVFDDRRGYRYEGKRKYIHSNAYVKGNKIFVTITYVTQFRQRDGWVVFGFKKGTEQEQNVMRSLY